MSALKPAVSVIIPTYNRLPALCELVETLSRQTFDQFETIIVNDCGESVDKVKELYPELKIRIVDLKTNVKQVRARNAGIEQASGAYIMLCDDDDLLLPGHMDKMVRQVESGRADLAYSDAEIFDYEWKNGSRVPTHRRLFAYDDDYEAMRRVSTFVASGCLYHRSLHDAIGNFDDGMNNYWDWDFYLRAAPKFKVSRVADATVLYAFSGLGGNQSADLSPKRNAFLDKLCEKHQLGELPMENFFTLLDKPEMKAREAASRIVWDGKPIVSRLVQ